MFRKLLASRVKPGMLIMSKANPRVYLPVQEVTRDKLNVTVKTHKEVTTINLLASVNVGVCSLSLDRSPLTKIVSALSDQASNARKLEANDAVYRLTRKLSKELVEVLSLVMEQIPKEVKHGRMAEASLWKIRKRAGNAAVPLNIVSAGIAVEHWFHRYGHLLEWIVQPYGVTDPGNWYFKNQAYIDGVDGSDDKVPVGKRTQMKCDNCGASLRRVGHARKSG